MWIKNNNNKYINKKLKILSLIYCSQIERIINQKMGYWGSGNKMLSNKMKIFTKFEIIELYLESSPWDGDASYLYKQKVYESIVEPDQTFQKGQAITH